MQFRIGHISRALAGGGKLSPWQSHLSAAILPAIIILITPWVTFPEETYAYDVDGQLIEVRYENGITLKYEYDGAGNILRRSVTTFQPSPEVLLVQDNVVIRFEKPLSGEYTIQESRNLRDWQLIHTATGTGIEEFVLPISTENNARFYRVNFQ